MIKEIPEIEELLLEALKKKRLILFLGAGASQHIDCSSWRYFAEELVKKCVSLPSSEINHCVKERILREYDSRKIVTTCYEILRSQGKEGDFISIMQNCLKDIDDLSEKENNLYKYISKLVISNLACILTTNADRHLSDFLPKWGSKFRSQDFQAEEFQEDFLHRANSIYYLHGSLSGYNKSETDEEKNDSLVFTIPQYSKRYNDPAFQRFLERVFGLGDFVTLFIGYSLSEFDLISRILGKENVNKSDSRRFVLQGYYSSEEAFYENFDKIYFESLGIKVIPYLKDKLDYKQEIEILKHWLEELKPQVIHETYIGLENEFDKLTRSL